jgi:hypothetical protein
LPTSGSRALEMLEQPHAAYPAASEKVVSDLWSGILGLTTETVLFTPMPTPRPSSSAHRSIPQDHTGRVAETDIGKLTLVPHWCRK